MSFFVAQAQFTAAQNDGTPITDGSIFTYNQTGDENALLTFNITNTGSESITMKLEYVSMSNGDGTGTYLCLFGICLPPGGISPGNIYAGNDNVIAPGATSTTDNHFYNTYVGDGTNYPVEYVFRLFQVDENDQEIGESITFTYRYDPDYNSIEDEQMITYSLFPTISSTKIQLYISEVVEGILYDTQGRIINTYKFVEGENNIDVSNLQSQLYYLMLNNNQGQHSVTRIIVK